MKVGPPLVEVSMVRENLRDLPFFPMPAAFSLRFYRPGDDITWTRIQQQAEKYHDITPELFGREFGGGEAQLSLRQLFLCDAEDREVGTGTAWFHDDYQGKSWGRIHWVAVAADHQGQGLGRAVVSALCHRLADLGHIRAFLTTESIRLPAINLYLSFGFKPEIKDDDDRSEWNVLLTRGVRWSPSTSQPLQL
jgi:GNAT superfamily N-acetyltransferase